MHWPESVEGCLAVPDSAVEPREPANPFGVAQSTVQYLTKALDTNEEGAMMSVVQLVQMELARYRTSLREDEGMLAQVLNTPTGDSTFM